MNNNTGKGGLKLSQIVKIIKRNVIIIALVIILAIGAGYGYTKMQKPTYTASEGMFFTATNLKYPTVAYNVNAMKAYIDTVLDFCDEGVVLDRAESYYVSYVNAKTSREQAGETYTLKQFFNDNELNDVYVEQENKVRAHYNKSSIRVYAEETEELETSFYFTISYTDGTYEQAATKAKILSYALNKESAKKISEDEYKYFDGIKIDVVNAGTIGVSNNLSKIKTMILFFLIGVAAAALVVYLKQVLDNTVKNTEDLEEITGASNFSHIGRKKGGN